MSDFYSVLRQSMIDRDLRTPGEREEAYAQARTAMIRRLWSFDPPLAEDEIDARIGLFDVAVDRIETDLVATFAEADRVAAANGGYRPGRGRSRPAALTYDPVPEVAPAYGSYAELAADVDDDPWAETPPPRPRLPARTLVEERSHAVEAALRAALAEDDVPVPALPAPRLAVAGGRRTDMRVRDDYDPRDDRYDTGEAAYPDERGLPDDGRYAPASARGRGDEAAYRDEPAYADDREDDGAGYRDEPGRHDDDDAGYREPAGYGDEAYRHDPYRDDDPAYRDPPPSGRDTGEVRASLRHDDDGYDDAAAAAGRSGREAVDRGRANRSKPGREKEPVSPEEKRIRILVAAIVGLAVVLLIVTAVLVAPILFGPSKQTPLQAAPAAPPVSDPATAERIPTEPADILRSFTLFDGRDPTVFEASAGNPVRYTGDPEGGFARISTSAASAGTRAHIGPGLANRLAGQNVRITVVARSSRENGAASLRFSYQSGVATSHWQTANLGGEFQSLGLVWRVPSIRTDPNGDYIIIEPGIPGAGTAADIQSIRIDVLR